MKPIINKKSKTSWKNKLLFFLLAIILIIVAISLSKSWQKNYQINQEIISLEKEIQTLEESNIELAKLIEYFNSNAYIEEKARMDLGLKKEGEKVVVAPNSLKPPSLATEATEKEKKEQKIISNPQKWWHYFFK